MRRSLVAAACVAFAGAAAEHAPPPRERVGSVFAVGGGGMPLGVRAEFLRLAGGADARIVVIPTASADADDPAQADSFTRGWTALGPAAVGVLHTRDRPTADSPAFAGRLAAATGVWMSGGDQSRLTAAYAGTRVEAGLRAVVRRGGVVGGTSAGAAVLGDPMIAGGADVPKLARGFGLLDSAIVDQHFTQRSRLKRLTRAVADTPGSVGLGVDEATAVVVTGGAARVVGTGTVTVLTPGTPGQPARTVVVEAGGTAGFGSPIAR